MTSVVTRYTKFKCVKWSTKFNIPTLGHGSHLSSPRSLVNPHPLVYH